LLVVNVSYISTLSINWIAVELIDLGSAKKIRGICLQHTVKMRLCTKHIAKADFVYSTLCKYNLVCNTLHEQTNYFQPR
jgi:hypothetical protein